jgi:hypothetical protein
MPEQKFVVPRRFRDYDSLGEGARSNLVWEDLASEHALVVLGEPGAGKSTELEQEAARLGTPFLSIREFLRTPVFPTSDGPLFLDALDETRAAGRDRNEVLDQVIERLLRLGSPQVRLSCRAADWLGGLDRRELSSVSPTTTVRVIELLPLTEDEAEQIARDRLGDASSSFMEMVRRHRLEGWLGNPQTLEMMIEVARKGDLPATRTELLEKACFIMAQEENRTHRSSLQDPARDPVGANEILAAAGFLYALALTAGLEGFAADQEDSDEFCPPLVHIPGSQRELRMAIGSRLYRWQEGRALPVHRTIAEFLAAKALCERVRKGLPLGRLLRLVTGYDGGTVSDLRGLYAWIASLLPEHASVLAAGDPVALIFYGDPQPLPSLVKREILKILGTWAERDPLFFYEGGSAQGFGGLADRGLIEDFRTVLTDSNQPPYLLLSVLAIVTYGQQLPELAGDLRSIVKDRVFSNEVRAFALRGLIHVVTDPSQLRPMLQGVHAGKILDEDDALRSHLLAALYPQEVGPKELIPYLTPRKTPRRHGYYFNFLRRILDSSTPDSLLPDLLDELSNTTAPYAPRRERPFPDLLGSLLRRGLDLFGGSVPIGRLWNWLGLVRDGWVVSILKGEDQVALRDWFSARPELVTQIYKWWVLESLTADYTFSNTDFWLTLCAPEVPSELWRWQLSMVESWPRDERAKSLFLAVLHGMREGRAPSWEDVYFWVERSFWYQGILESFLEAQRTQGDVCPDMTEQDRVEEHQEAATLGSDILFIQQRLAKVRAGKNKRILDFLAALFLDPGDPEGPVDLHRIRLEFGEDITDAAEKGFVALLDSKRLPTPDQVGRIVAEGREFPGCYAVIAGAILLFKRGDLPTLHENPGLRAALAFEFTHGVYYPRGWFESIIQREPKEAAIVIESAWRPLLRKGCAELPHVQEMDRDPVMSLVAGEVGLRLLESFPKSNAKLLEQLMRAALAGGPKALIAHLVSAQVDNFSEHDQEQQALWIVMLLLVDSDEGIREAQSFLGRGESADKVAILVKILERLSHVGDYSIEKWSPLVLAELIHLLGPYCLPRSLEGYGGDFRRAQLFGNLIDLLGSHIEGESITLMASLRDDRGLTPWREKLSHTLEQQRRKAREQRYRRPSLAEVIKILENKEPTCLADLFEVLCDQLRTLAKELENGPEDGYRMFWNITPRKN